MKGTHDKGLGSPQEEGGGQSGEWGSLREKVRAGGFSGSR